MFATFHSAMDAESSVFGTRSCFSQARAGVTIRSCWGYYQIVLGLLSDRAGSRCSARGHVLCENFSHG